MGGPNGRKVMMGGHDGRSWNGGHGHDGRSCFFL